MVLLRILNCNNVYEDKAVPGINWTWGVMAFVVKPALGHNVISGSYKGQPICLEWFIGRNGMEFSIRLSAQQHSLDIDISRNTLPDQIDLFPANVNKEILNVFHSTPIDLLAFKDGELKAHLEGFYYLRFPWDLGRRSNIYPDSDCQNIGQNIEEILDQILKLSANLSKS